MLARWSQAILAVISSSTIAGMGLPPITDRWVKIAKHMVIASSRPPNPAVTGMSRAIAAVTSTSPVTVRNH
ncbi:hypothetical protein D3C80_1474200 [compost metagenome]